MHWPARCATIIPCRNEEASIAVVVEGARKFLPSVIVVDDGSTDGTAERAAAAGARVAKLAGRQGKGAALLAGFEMARHLRLSWALTMDGDGQHAPEEIPRLLQKAASTGADLVVGNRFGSENAMPWLRRTANKTMSAALSRRLGLHLPDSQCGFRLLRLACVRETDFVTRHFEFESEMLAAFAARGMAIEFTPVTGIYAGQCSKIRVLPDTWRWLRWLVSSSSRNKFRRR